MAYINAISYYLPQKSYSNEDIIADYKKYAGANAEEIDPDQIYQQCGVRKRYSAPLNDTAKDLGNQAGLKLFDEWSIDRLSIDYIIFISDALDYKGPTTACVMQRDLELSEHVGAIDILHGCTGWVYGMSLAKALIQSDQASSILVITADTPTKVVHPEDVELRAIFSDGAAATLVEKIKSPALGLRIDDFIFGTDGKGEKNLYTSRSATKDPADIEWLKQHEHLPGGLTRGRLVMKSAQIFLFAVRKVPFLIKEVLSKNNVEKDDIDFFVLHQANGQMLEFLRKKMNIKKEKFIINIEEVGNTVSATIPIALKQMIDNGDIKNNKRILVGGFGIGYSWGGTIISKD